MQINEGHQIYVHKYSYFVYWTFDASWEKHACKATNLGKITDKEERGEVRGTSSIFPGKGEFQFYIWVCCFDVFFNMIFSM